MSRSILRNPQAISRLTVAGTVLCAAAAIVSPQQKHTAPSGPAVQLGRTIVQPKTAVTMNDGTVEGYVYWDAARTRHIPANSCSGLTVTLSVSANGSTYTSLGTQTNNFSPMGQVGGYEVCIYSFHRLPVGPKLRVQIGVNPAAAFSPAVNPPAAMDVNVINGKCNNLPPAVPSASQLQQNWWTCQNIAYNVNFALLPARALLGATGNGVLLRPTAGPIGPGLVSAAPQVNASKVPAGKVLLGANPASRTTSLGKAPAAALGPAKAPIKIENTTALKQESALIGLLTRQRQAADAESAQIKASVGTGGLLSTPSRVMSSTTTSPSRITAVAPAAINNIALTCAHDPDMRVLTISGGQQTATFTQDPKYNFYTLSGCSFGDPGPNAKAYIYYQGSFHLDFIIDQWSENQISMHLNPNLTGIDDQNNVTLIIQRADGKQASRTGLRFYAERQTIQLRQIPQQHFTLDKFRPDSAATASWKVSYTSESTAQAPPHLQGHSAEVHWDLGSMSASLPNSGDDIYDLRTLRPSFVAIDAALIPVDLSCTDPSFRWFETSKAPWKIDWYNGSEVQIVWQGQACNNTPNSCGGAFQPDCFAPVAESNYAMDVWVRGPKGVNPWPN